MQTITVIGGSGELGGGLALRWAKAGIPVVIGSRDTERAAQVANDINAASGNDLARGMENYPAAEAGNIVVLAVKFEHHKTTLEQLAPALKGKILVDTTVPLVPPKVMRVQLPEGGSAAVSAQRLLGPEVEVISAFQNVSATALKSDAEPECDVLVTGAKADTRQKVIELVEAAGFRGWHAGALENSAAPEALTSLLIFMNKKYDSDHVGIRITGIDQD